MGHEAKRPGFLTRMRRRLQPSISITATTASGAANYFTASKSGRARRAAPPHFAKRPPTFLLLEGLDGARVVHHCDVQRASSRTACLRKPSCGARGQKLRCGCVGVLSAPILPNGLTADAQTEATPVSAPLPTVHGCCHGDRQWGRSENGHVPPPIYRLREMTTEAGLGWTDKDGY